MATKADIMSDYYRMPKNKAGVLADYGKLTRLANDRLREIEKRSTTDGLTSLTQYAYKRAVHDLSGATRFPSKEKIENLNYNAIVKRMNDMRRFLRSKSSTTRGVKSMYSQNASRFNKKYGTNFTQSQLAKFFDKNTGLYEKIKSKNPDWGSETVMKAIAQIRQNKDEVLEQMERENKNHIDTDSVKVNEVINELLTEYGDDIKELLES